MKATDIDKIWLSDSGIWIRNKEGNEAFEPFYLYERLANASQIQREEYEVGAYGLHWPELDEDLSFDGFFQNKANSNI